MVYDEQSKSVLNTYKNMSEQGIGEIKNDPYYEYFYNLLETGRTYVNYSYARLVKSVDETWVEAIENALESLQNTIRNPRRFIEEDREIVNIAMARNITAESVRHLLSHSNYIDEYRKDGTVIPNKILNVFKEESLNTYENRFICTLLGELQYFINKRFDAIFEATKDEIGVNFETSSVIDNYTETIDYHLSIRIRDKKTDVESEKESKDIFSRIIKLHRVVNMLVTTEFITTMRRFPSVTHPIVKTNAIAKNKDYKACYELWNFIQTYSKVGYEVNLLKQQPNISKDFENDIYHSLMWNYSMLHNYMDYVDEANINREKRKKEISIEGIRQVLEEIVDQSDLPEETLHQLVTSELSKIQKRKRSERQGAERLGLKADKKTRKSRQK